MAELDPAAVIALKNYDMLLFRVYMGTASLVIFEFLVTFDTEVRLFWGREITGASVIFFVNRYTMLLYTILSLWQHGSPVATSASTCIPVGYTMVTLELCNYFPWAAFSALRVFALTRGNWFLAPLVFVLSLGPIIANFVTIHWAPIVYNLGSVYGCAEDGTGIGSTLSIIFAVLTRGPLIIADIIVIVVTWVTTYKTATLSRSVLDNNQPTFAGLLLRDGTLYFTIMLSMNVLEIAFEIRNEPCARVSF